MKYTLSENAISSLSIAIEHFKKFYYFEDRYESSQLDEATKISLVFLENSVELMIKTILVKRNKLAIYLEPNSKKIQGALARSSASMKLEDILISEGNFRTIKYEEAVKEYNSIYHNSKKVNDILTKLGHMRNAITHFGIDQTKDRDGLIVLFINTFDVIYNYLYRQLKRLDGIGEYFTSDGLAVKTIHGDKDLLDEEDVYNNILDFLDEMLEASKEYVCSLHISNPKKKIQEFTLIAKDLFEDHKFAKLLADDMTHIKFSDCDYSCNSFGFEIIKDSEQLDNVHSCYSPYFNVTAFCGETSSVYFLIVHEKKELYIYSDPFGWPSWNEPEEDERWVSDCTNGACRKYNLSKRNLLLAFESMLLQIEEA